MSDLDLNVVSTRPDEPDATVVRSARLEQLSERGAETQRVLTGDRPTGPLHLGHYFGTLENRVRLQDLGADLMVLVADYQTIIDRDSPESLVQDVEGLIADYLAVGIDPNRSTIFAHSQVEALNQLMLPFLSLVSVAELSRNPTIKEEMAAAGQTSMSGLMFTYPVHQAADILFCKATAVPVGRDQVPHLELARLIARRFNRRYGADHALFPEPSALLSDAPAVLGTDGGKMSKSRGNAIAISASADETARLIAGTKTDGHRHIAYDPVHRPEVSNLVLLGALCQRREPDDVASEIGDGGSYALKRLVTEAINERFRDIRKRRAELIDDPGYLRQVLRDGTTRAREIANDTLQEVRELMHTDYPTGPATTGPATTGRRP